MPDFRMLGKVRGIFRDQDATGNEGERLHLSGQSETLVANAAAPYQEIVRQGAAFYTGTATAIASVTAIPTTAVGIAIFNGEDPGGKSYIIDQVAALYTVNTAAIPQTGIIANLGQARPAALPADVGSTVTVKKANGWGGATMRPTNAIVIVGGTALDAITGVAVNWFPLGSSVNAAVTSLPGFQQVVNVDGRIVVPPGRYFAIHTIASVTSCSAQCFIWWHEKQLALG